MKPLPFLLAAGAVAVLAAGYAGYVSLYAAPRAALVERLEAARLNAASYEGAVGERKAVRARLGAIAATTLGARLDAFEHQFRTRLTGALESCGLSAIVVSSGQPSGVRSPAVEARLTPRIAAALRKQEDFRIVRGEAEGEGTLEQVMRALTVASAQTWVHRVEGFSIEPLGREREKFRLRLDVATLYLPDLAAADWAGPPAVTPPENAAGLWGPVVAKNVFRRPPPEAPPRPAEPVVAQGTQPPPPGALYGEWRLTGIAMLPRLGLQALVVNTRTSESRQLAPGERVLDAVFEGGEGERAVFRIADRRFEVMSGQSLAERRPLN